METCQEECLEDAETVDPCWAIAHWNEFSGNDCWKFYSSDPNICITNMGPYDGVNLGIKICYEGE